MNVGPESFRYDIAFSFLAQDEAVAVQLNDLLHGRFSTFLYSERQKELAGRDGEIAFNEVFATDARSVVVLYRDGWGQTPWTRIEETAIRNRAHSEGYDFCLFVPLGDKATVPRWLPRNRLWIGFERWGANGAAAVIEARVADLGGNPHIETLEDFAAREGRRASYEAERSSALRRGDLLQVNRAEASKVTAALKEAVNRFNSVQNSIQLTFRQREAGHSPAITGLVDSFTFTFHMAFANSLDGSDFSAIIWDGAAPTAGYFLVDKPKQRKRLKIQFDFSITGEYVWVVAGRQFSSVKLADHLLQWYVTGARRR